MSDEIDLDQSHLCTTEDAFEKFQAVSMYEEDEFITLSDIVPPQPEVPNVGSEHSDIPYENEVVLESNLEEQVPEVNSTIEISAEEDLLVEASAAPAELCESAEHLPPPPTTNESRPLKRGRKKKIHQNELLPTDVEQPETHNGNADISSQSSEAMPVAPTPQRRRGRPPKHANRTQQPDVSVECSDTPIESSESINSGRLENTNSSQINDSQNFISPPQKVPRKRGRPRKSIENEQVLVNNSLSELEQSDSVNNMSDPSPLETHVPKKRGRKKKILVMNDESNSNVEENNELEQTFELPIEQPDREPQVSPIKKTPGKRGRPRKIQPDDKPAIEIDNQENTVKEVPKEDDDDGDDISLSQLKNTLEEKDVHEDSQVEPKSDEVISTDVTIELTEEVPLEPITEVSDDNSLKVCSETITKRNSKQPVMEDFEYNIDSIVTEKTSAKEKIEDQLLDNDSADKDSLLVEDTSKRPVRRKVKQFHYDEGSDEDPFANIELSDEDDMRGRKGRYYSDDEYIPGVIKKRGSKQVEDVGESDTTDSDIDNIKDEMIHFRRKRQKKLDGSPCKKRGKKPNKEEKALGKFSPEVSTIKPDDNNVGDNDVEICLETSIIKATDDAKKVWGSTNEFENFLAKKIHGTDIKIKKASTPVQPLEIPVIDPAEAKKTIEISTQTTEVPTTSKAIQTTAPYDAPMKDNIPLTPDQSEKACEFLNNIVKTTAELGELMTQKSQDFIKKKINTNHVTDTFKMDYCVRKSFLLFKLAKHNLMQMEEDLAKQYDNFLESHNLSQHREKPKVLEPEQKAKDSDSDCEIIETPAPQKPKKPLPFNPKTVFLNKELSIKIAKKPTDKKIDIKGRHTVWINDSVMVKKVKPTQSFLAQDSRNKKPPDCVTIEMVSAFFEQYYREKALVTCAPFVSSEWISQERICVCNYFFANTEDFPPNREIPSGSGHCEDTERNISAGDGNDKICNSSVEKVGVKDLSPKSLFSLCTQVLQHHLQYTKSSHSNVGSPRSEIVPITVCKNPATLYSLCVDIVNAGISYETKNEDVIYRTPLSLKTLCYIAVTKIFCTTSRPIFDRTSKTSMHEYFDESIASSRPDSSVEEYNENIFDSWANLKLEICMNFCDKSVRSLSSLCLDLINNKLNSHDHVTNNLVISNVIHIPNKVKYNPNTLKSVAYKTVVDLIYNDDNKLHKLSQKSQRNKRARKVKTLADLCFEIVTRAFSDNDNGTLKKGLTINAVNTLTEEAYHNIDQSELSENADDYYADDDSNFYDDEIGINNVEESDHAPDMADNWLSQVEMKISSCYDPNVSTVQESRVKEHVQNSINNDPVVARIKLEPLDEVPETVDTSIVKSEPMVHLDEMTVIPEGIVTKSEFIDLPTAPREPIQRQNSSSFDVDQFEAFVSTNKMMYNVNNYDNDDEVFTQSALRIRRQHEPDSDTENDMSMSLLVPQTYEPMPILEKNKVKDSLMESSSDEGSNNKKVPTKKKPDKPRRGRPKKNESKPANKDPPKDKANEIAILTRRMRDKIRQEEKKVASSDSEQEAEKIVPKKGKEKHKENIDNTKTTSTSKLEEKVDTVKDDVPDNKLISKDKKPSDEEIQCSNVDSTEQVNENLPIDPNNSSPGQHFTGFTAVDQNEISSYQKYVNYVYEKIMPDDEENNKQPLIHPEEPVELLECEPTMPFLMEEPTSLSKPSARKRTSKKQEKKDIAEPTTLPQSEEEEKVESASDPKSEENKLYVERHGWKCYPLDSSDTKLYQNAHIFLEKLPESFVETYFRYQDLTNKNAEDDEVDRLTNLQSLNRSSVKEGVSEGKCKGRPKCKIQPQVKNAVYSILGLEQNAEDGVNIPSPAHSEHYDEFTPSEDEGGKVDEEAAPPMEKPTSENNLAKSSLMDDNDSDGETKVKQEPKDADAKQPPAEADTKPAKKYRPGPKCKKMKEEEPPAPVMLTADKMMNKELNLLHAPVTIDEEPVKVKTLPKGPVTRNKQKNANKTSPKVRVKAEDDSSSEEEKQWFTIKEKLLKKMVKKNDTTREDDAKRAKLVSEFIERRGDGTESYIKKRRGVRGRRSKKKLLERQKQLRVLTRELFGDPSNDASLQRKKQTAAYFKGRRNIRKVIDKKSLAKSTVVANMEEFERKRRLNIRQAKLREVLRCEEGVNVLVINDEVCLEYDFEQHRPVVTIHPFFTKVMKAHQYEGVKFMWDACFESLECIAAGSPGSGCILAHCMGLGKTLQVLALLHTVLTHPGVGMQRVLVCCPLSTVLNWVDEIHKWIGPVTNQIKVFELSKLRKTYERAYQLEDWYNGGGIFIIGYELFRSLTTLDPFLDDVRPTIINKIRTALLDPGPDIVICDEGHLLKNDCSVLAVAMSRVATRRRVVLTGTPMQNNLREYYCMVSFVKPNLLGTYSEYSNRFENPIMNGQHRDSSEEDIKLMKARTHILHKVLEGCLQRQEASVLYPYLPKKHEYTVFISLTKCQWDLYKHYLKYYGNTQNNKSILKDFHILQKIWSHPQVLHNFQTRVCDEAKAKTKDKEKVEKLEDDLAHEDLNETADVKPSDTEVWWLQYLDGGAMLDSLTSSNKFVAVFRILDESVALGDKVLIFSTSLFTMDVLEFFLKKIKNWSLGQEYYRLDGSVPAEVRQKWCREFNAENNLKTKLFLISTRAGSLGLNMTAANRVIILDTSWNPAHDIQSIFRVYRFGQKKDCYIYRLVALGTMEQKIYERSVTKQAVACRVVDEQQIDRHYNMAELTELYKYDEAGVGVAGGVAVGVADVVLLRVARDAALHAATEHDSLLRGSGEQGLPEHERNAAWMQFQQEHAHKQMQEDALQQALLEQKLKREEEPPPKRPPRKYAKLKLPVAAEECILPEPAPAAPAPPKQRGRRPRKATVVSCCIPIQPEAAETHDPDMEVAMVKQITDILLQHNFQSRKSAAEISDLVARVRHIVTSGRIDLLDATDGLTMSIANVFLQHKDAPMPALTDIAPAEPGPSAVKEEPPEPVKPPPKPKGRRKGSGKKMYVYEEIPSTSSEPAPAPESVVDAEGRTRRRAALAAERNFDTSDSVIDIDDDDWQNDDSQNDSDAPISAIKDDERREPRQRKTHTRTEQIVPKYEKLDPPPQVISEDSILLSDDDEPTVKRKPGPKSRTRLGQVEENVEFARDSRPSVPLHPTLLSNKNFIRIVAHTYLSGNPMLDEDAATLAAQYSTFKALKEYESTGKNIDKGPIYDIAMKVIGYDVLKNLHQSSTKIVASDIIAAHPINSKETAVTPTPATPRPATAGVKPEVSTGVAPEPKKPVKLRIKIPPLPPRLAATARVPLPPGADVVPVGLFKRAEEGPSITADECILPDDDDIHIISDPTPSQPPPVPAAAAVPVPAAAGPVPAAAPDPSPVSLVRRNSKRMIITKVKADTRPAQSPAVSVPKKPIIISASGRLQIVASGPPASPPEPGPESILSDLGAPISLDSDDDDAPAPTPRPPEGPVPVLRKSSNNGLIVTAGPAQSTQVAATPPVVPASMPPVVPAAVSSVATAATPSGRNYLYIPAAKGAVPVALSRAPPPPPGASVQRMKGLTFRPEPVPAAPPAAPRLAPQPPAPRLAPQPPAPRLAPQPPAPRLAPPPPAPQPPAAPSAPTSKRLCKPGDILRVTNDGQLEVVSMDEPPARKAAPAPAPAPTPAPVAAPAPAPTPVADNPPPRRNTSSQSLLKPTPTPPKKTPEPSTAKKDDDPLSILRDVIHIEADDYDTEVQFAARNPPTRAPESRKPPTRTAESQKPPTRTYENRNSQKPTPAKAPTSTEKYHTVLSHNTPSKQEKPVEKTNKVSTSGREQKKAPEQKKKERFLGSVDLTDVDAPACPAASSSKPRILKGATTIVGTSKSIILCGSGKAVAKSNAETAKREYSAKIADSMASTSKKPVAKKPEVKKRPATVDPAAAKKIKTDKPMTLKDFNIDDIDDIIELD